MAYVRTRTTKTGQVSTTLVESYRDESGRPRQRILTNLHGEPDLLRALAKLTAMHDTLLEELQEGAESSKLGTGFIMVSDRALAEYDHRTARIVRQLATIERDMAVINEHLPPVGDNEFQATVRRYKEDCGKALYRAMGLAMASKQANAAVRRKLA
jgi:hypothetical protein